MLYIYYINIHIRLCVLKCNWNYLLFDMYPQLLCFFNLTIFPSCFLYLMTSFTIFWRVTLWLYPRLTPTEFVINFILLLTCRKKKCLKKFIFDVTFLVGTKKWLKMFFSPWNSFCKVVFTFCSRGKIDEILYNDDRPDSIPFYAQDAVSIKSRINGIGYEHFRALEFAFAIQLCKNQTKRTLEWAGVVCTRFELYKKK